jgi:two-component system nitrogen regulation response regulator GlnG
MTAKVLSVWVVDDDASVRWVLERALTNEGIDTRVFDSADALFDALRDAAPTC